MFGLNEQDVEYIRKFILEFESIQEVIIFGSRAMGNFREGSDVDIAIKGKDTRLEEIQSISYYLNEELSAPYYFDIIHYDMIQNISLKKHIDAEGRQIFKK